MIRYALTAVALTLGVCSVSVADVESQDDIQLNFAYYESTIDDIHHTLEHDGASCYSIVKAFTDRILQYDMAVNHSLPFNSIQHINQHALDQAIHLDLYYKKHQKLKGALHCVPVLVKDNISTEYMPMTSGSFALLNNRPHRNAPAIQRIEQAGGIILASTTMDEFSSGSDAVSSRHGRTANAYEVEQAAGGSSSGSAVAVSLNFGVLALATDVYASSRIPASRNGLYTARPTAHQGSTQGVLSSHPQMDYVVPMARTPKDLATALHVLYGEQSHSYRTKLHKGGLQGRRIGLLQSLNGIDLYQHEQLKTLKQYQHFIKRLKGLGAQLTLKVTLEHIQPISPKAPMIDVDAFNAALKTYPSVRKDFMDVCESKRTNVFKGEVSCDALYQQSVEYKNSINEKMKHNQAVLNQLMQDKQIDLLLLPLPHVDNNVSAVQVVSELGVPAVNILTGYEQDGVPIAMQMIARPGQEHLLLSAIYDYDLHYTPRSVPTIYSRPTNRFKSIQAFNFFKDELGQFVFEQFLSEHQNQALTATVFSKVYRSFIQKKGRA